MRHCECLTDLDDLLGVQPEVEVAEDEVRQPLEALIRDPAERLRHTRSLVIISAGAPPSGRVSDR